MEIAIAAPNNSIDLKKEAKPFLYVSIVWLALSALISRGLGIWLVVLWFLSVADLAAMTFAFRAVFGIMNDAPEKRAAYVLNASVWGAIKLACVLLFGIVLFKGQNIPSRELLLGMGTMVAVPLAGGFWWSQRALQGSNHA